MRAEAGLLKKGERATRKSIFGLGRSVLVRCIECCAVWWRRTRPDRYASRPVHANANKG